MKFERNNLNLEKKIEEQKAPAVVEETPAVINTTETVPEAPVAEPTPEVTAPAVETPVAAVEETPTAVEEAKTAPAQESLAEKFKIPEFDPKAFPKAPQGIFTRVHHTPPTVAPTPPVEEVVQVKGEDVKSIDLVDEVPEGEPVVDGVEIVGDLPPEVEEKLEADLSVAQEEVAVDPAPTLEPPAVEWTGNCEKCGAPEHFCTCNEVPEEAPAAPVEEEKPADPIPEPEKAEEPKEEATTSAEQFAWDKFIDFVIVPTLLTCLDRAKDYITTVLADDLKKNNPDA